MWFCYLSQFIWAVACDFQQYGVCDQQGLRPACAYAQPDQSLCLSLTYSMSVKLLTEHHFEVLSLKGGCTGSSESTLIKTPDCWKSHVRARIIFRLWTRMRSDLVGQWGWYLPEFLSTSIRYVCEQGKLWRDCHYADMEAHLSLVAYSVTCWLNCTSDCMIATIVPFLVSRFYSKSLYLAWHSGLGITRPQITQPCFSQLNLYYTEALIYVAR